MSDVMNSQKSQKYWQYLFLEVIFKDLWFDSLSHDVFLKFQIVVCEKAFITTLDYIALLHKLHKDNGIQIKIIR